LFTLNKPNLFNFVLIQFICCAVFVFKKGDINAVLKNEVFCVDDDDYFYG